MISLISSWSLELYLNLLVCLRNIFGSSSKVFGNLRKFSEILEKCWERSSGLRKNFGKSSEIFGKSSENTVISMFLWQKNHYTLARRYKFHVFVARTTSHERAWRTSEILFLPLEHKINIFSPPCDILYVFKRGDHRRYGYIINRAFFTGVYIINRILHAHLRIWILSSRV